MKKQKNIVKYLMCLSPFWLNGISSVETLNPFPLKRESKL